MNKNVLEVTIGHVTIIATGLAAVIVGQLRTVVLAVAACAGSVSWLR